jgi:HSP20 family molecular chaperone IbpA
MTNEKVVQNVVSDVNVPSSSLSSTSATSSIQPESINPTIPSTLSSSSSPSITTASSTPTTDDLKRSSIPTSKDSTVATQEAQQQQQLQHLGDWNGWRSLFNNDLWNSFDNFALDPMEWVWSPFDGRRQHRTERRLSNMMSSMFDQFDRTLQHFDKQFERPLKQLEEMSMNVTMNEDDNNYGLTVDLPSSIPKDSVKLDLRGRQLTISAEHSSKHEDKDKGIQSQSSSSTVRSILLPKNADIEKINAKFGGDNNNQLKVMVPKRVTALNENRRIAIEST